MSKRKIEASNSSTRVEEESEEPQAKTKIAPIFANAATSSEQQKYGVWKDLADHLMIYTCQGVKNLSKIAAFDLDGTLIKTKSGRVFPTNVEDWQLWSREVVTKLRKCHEDNFKLCIFTNQMGIQKKHVNPSDFKKKIQNICMALGVPIQVFISIGSSAYRKPYIGMWTRLEEQENGGVKIRRDQSIYVGDAAGRTKTAKRAKADHSCADRLFALNLGLRFHTPEQYFAGRAEEEPFQLPQFNPAELLEKQADNSSLPAQLPGLSQPELLVAVGPPASGKSTFARKLMGASGGKQYSVFSQDQLGSWKACLDGASRALASGRSAIIDNTNREPGTRKPYIELATSLGVPCRCLLFDCSPALALHNNAFRQIISESEEFEQDKAHKRVDAMAIRMFFANYKEPKLEEGFTQIVRVPFVPDFSDDGIDSEKEKRRKAIYGLYLTEDKR